jgi:hypothetical protein
VYVEVYVVFHLIAASHVHMVLSLPVLAVLAGMTAVRQTLMRTASCGR